MTAIKTEEECARLDELYALHDGDTEYIKACGLTDNAIRAMRWKLAHEAIKEAV